MTLTYRGEYAALPQADRPPPVLLLQEWLARHLDAIPRGQAGGAPFTLLPHCTERSTAVASLRDWHAAFAAAGAELRIPPSGCCGMAGTYGHEAEHRESSTRIYAMGWAKKVAGQGQGNGADESGRLLATGYSCRSQVKRMEGRRLLHPARALLDQVRRASGEAVG